VSPLAGKRILLGVTGSIAAYKAVELARGLRRAGAEVQVVTTPGAREFVAPLTFQALTGRPLRCELFDPAAEAAMDHIELARWAEWVLVAPASADFLARIAQGLADDLLTTLCLATEAPLWVAPAMNRVMWRHPATQANIGVLRGRGVRVLGPDQGAQACGEEGPGRMLEAEAILRLLAGDGPLSGVSVLVTAGPTREPIDPVRFLSNRSSGRMGYALAAALAGLGAEVTLVSGPVALPSPPGVARVNVETALEMASVVEARAGDAAIFVAAAAVADYRPVHVPGHKIKKRDARRTLELTPNPDILATVAARPDAPFCLGFAAETRDLEANARSKLEAKGLDMIAANLVGGSEGGFESEDNALLVLWPGGRHEFPLLPKQALARRLADLLAVRFRAARGPEPDSGESDARD